MTMMTTTTAVDGKIKSWRNKETHNTYKSETRKKNMGQEETLT